MQLRVVSFIKFFQCINYRGRQIAKRVSLSIGISLSHGRSTISIVSWLVRLANRAKGCINSSWCYCGHFKNAGISNYFTCPVINEQRKSSQRYQLSHIYLAQIQACE